MRAKFIISVIPHISKRSTIGFRARFMVDHTQKKGIPVCHEEVLYEILHIYRSLCEPSDKANLATGATERTERQGDLREHSDRGEPSELSDYSDKGDQENVF